MALVLIRGPVIGSVRKLILWAVMESIIGSILGSAIALVMWVFMGLVMELAKGTESVWGLIILSVLTLQRDHHFKQELSPAGHDWARWSLQQGRRRSCLLQVGHSPPPLHSSPPHCDGYRCSFFKTNVFTHKIIQFLAIFRNKHLSISNILQRRNTKSDAAGQCGNCSIMKMEISDFPLP